MKVFSKFADTGRILISIISTSHPLGMKKYSIVFLLFILSKTCLAQIQENETTANIDANYSVFGNNNSISTTGSNTPIIPLLSGTFDYAFTNLFSYGAGLSFQEFTNNQQYPSPVTGNNSGQPGGGGVQNYPGITLTENIEVTDIGVHLFIHPLKLPGKMDTYCGIRFGYFFSSFPSNSLSYTFVIGGSIYANNLIGLNLEAGFGNLYYYAGGGLSLLIRRHHTTPTPPSH
ncbi:MAG: hypothetical protein HKL88_02610 [Bacteroidia bacterium]|jgi:hypothetical protein|nr:hypothetical protein [Bacteroidia bacterium]